MRIVALALLVAMSVALSACGGKETDQAVIGTATLVRVLKAVGFNNLVVLSNKKSLEQLGKQLARPGLAAHPANEDVVFTHGFTNPLLMPLTAVRFPSITAAVLRLKVDQPLLHGSLTAQERRLLPRGYTIKGLTDVQICNVVVTSYNPHRDRTLQLRFSRAVSRLRQRC